jgi:predicted nucleic acid-binding protein
MRRVLDSWAVLAWLHDEGPAAKRVQKLLDQAGAGAAHLYMSIINIGEVYYRLVRKRGPESAKAFLADLKKMSIEVIPAPNTLVLEAADLKSQYPISYADAFAAVTAVRQRATLVTGDVELRALDRAGLIEIEWLKRQRTQSG